MWSGTIGLILRPQEGLTENPAHIFRPPSSSLARAAGARRARGARAHRSRWLSGAWAELATDETQYDPPLTKDGGAPRGFSVGFP